MKSIYVKDLATDAPVRTSFLVQSKERKTASTGAAYLDLTLQDTTGVICAKLWDYSERTTPPFENDDVIQVEGSVESFRGAPQLKIKKISLLPIEDINLLDYLPRTKRDPEEMFATLLGRVRKIAPGPLQTLLLSVLEDPALAAKYKLAPAAMSYHHAFLGGLLEHVLSLVTLGDQVADHYPWLRRDLIVAGLVLHDLGKLEELSFAGGFRYSTRGQLIGHISMGLEMVQTRIHAIPDFPAALKNELEHIILSHHGKLEFGSPKEPAFAEAMVVSFLDEMDSKLEAVRAQYATDKDRPGDFTSRNPALKRELLKPR
jgi:3'-5' exoribonuclease